MPGPPSSFQHRQRRERINNETRRLLHRHCRLQRNAVIGIRNNVLGPRAVAVATHRARNTLAHEPTPQQPAAGSDHRASPFPTGHGRQRFKRAVLALKQQQIGRIARRRRNLHQHLPTPRPRHRPLQHLQPANRVGNVLAVLAKHHRTHFFGNLVRHASKIQCTPLAPREAFYSPSEPATLMLLAIHSPNAFLNSRSTMRFIKLVISTILLVNCRTSRTNRRLDRHVGADTRRTRRHLSGNARYKDRRTDAAHTRRRNRHARIPGDPPQRQTALRSMPAAERRRRRRRLRNLRRQFTHAC